MVARGCKKTPTDSNSTPSGRTCSDACEASVPDSTFKLWLRAAAGRSARAATTLYLSAPDGIRSWVERRYAGLIREALEAAGAALSEISFAPRSRPDGRASGGDGLNPNYTFERFVIGEGNRFAHAAALAVAEAPSEAYNPLFLHGPPGPRQDPPAGRDRQLPARQRPRRSASATRPPSASPTSSSTRCAAKRRRGASSSRYRDLDVLLVDDVQFLEGKQHTEEEFFHTFNALYEGGSQLVLSADRMPSELSTLADAAARPLRVGADGRGRAAQPRHPPDRPAAPRPRGRAPDGEGDGAPAELAGRINANVRQLHGALTRVIAHASLTARAARLGADRRADPAVLAAAPGRRRSRRSSSASPTAFGISRAELVGSSRAATPLRARQVAIFLTRELTDLSLPQIGRLYGGRDHSTVLNSLRRIEVGIGEDPSLADRVDKLRARDPQPRRQARPDGRRHCKNQWPSHSPLHNRQSPVPMRDSTPILGVSTSTNPTQEGNHQLKLTTKRDELVSKLSVVSRAVSTRAATQSLSGILIAVDEGGRSASRATDLEMGLQTELEAEAEGAGSVLLPGRLLAELARSLGDDDGRDRAARGRARRRDPQRRLELPPARPARRGLPASSRPRASEPLKIPAAALAETVERRRPRRLARRHAPGPDRRPGQRQRRGDDDGRHRLLPARGQADRARAARSAASSRRTSRPGRCASWAASSPPTASRRSRSACCRNQAVFRAGAIVLNTRLIDGQFPNFRQLLPESYEHDVRLPRQEFLDVTRRVSQLAQRNAPLRLSLRPGRADGRRLDARRRRRRGDDAGGLRGRAAGDRLQPRVPQARGSRASRATR